MAERYFEGLYAKESNGDGEEFLRSILALVTADDNKQVERPASGEEILRAVESLKQSQHFRPRWVLWRFLPRVLGHHRRRH